MMRLSNNLEDFFRHILKISSSMYESSGSQFFRITTGIQSGPDTFDESRFVMIFLTILRVMEICSLRLVLEGKTGKEIPESSSLKFFENFLANCIVLSDAEDNTCGPLNPLNRGSIENTISSSPIVMWEVINSSVLVAYGSLAASRTIVQRILACLNFTIDFEDLFCWYK